MKILAVTGFVGDCWVGVRARLKDTLWRMTRARYLAFIHSGYFYLAGSDSDARQLHAC